MPRFVTFKTVFAVALGAALSACAAQAPPLATTGSVVRVASFDALPPPTGDIANRLSSGTLSPRDHLSISVFNVPEMSLQDVEVSASGYVSVPLAGNFMAAGKTAQQLAREIEAALQRNYVRNPRVAVNLRAAVDKVFTIDGAVKRPGEFTANENLSLMKAVAVAQGLTETAKVESVVIYRRVGDQQMAAIYDLGAIRRGIYADPKIYPDDTILVGESAARRVYRDILQILPTLASPLVFVLQQF